MKGRNGCQTPIRDWKTVGVTGYPFRKSLTEGLRAATSINDVLGARESRRARPAKRWRLAYTIEKKRRRAIERLNATADRAQVATDYKPRVVKRSR